MKPTFIQTAILYTALLALPFLVISCAMDDTHSDDRKIWYSPEETRDLAVSDDRKILFDVYADNCSTSEKLRDYVYPDKQVRKTLQKYFHPIRVNANSGDSINFSGMKMTQKEFAGWLGVSTYPTMVFMDNDGEVIMLATRFMDADKFNQVLSYIGSGAYLTTEFDLFVNGL